jgi:hypothetical protein
LRKIICHQNNIIKYNHDKSKNISNYTLKLIVPVSILVLYLKVLSPSLELFIRKTTSSAWILLPSILGLGTGLYILLAAWVGILRPSYFKNFSI